MKRVAGGRKQTADGQQNAAEEQYLPPRFNVASTSRLLPVAVCCLFALALRLPGLTWGLPNAEHWYSYHPDERQIAQSVYNVLMSSNWNPQFFNYPSLFIYLTYFAYSLQSLLGLTTPLQGQAPWPFLHDAMLCGRIVSALLGAFTVPAVYLIGKRLANEKLALFAAFLMAVAPGHVQHSHFATVDVPATFFVAWALYFAVRAMLPPPNLPLRGWSDAYETITPPPEGEVGWGQKSLFIAAFLCGLAAATKYNAGLVLSAPLTVLWIGQFPKKPVLFFGAIAITTFGFVLACPHSVLNTAQFLGDRQNNGLLYELFVHSRQGHGDVFVNTGNGWLYHLTFNLPFAFTAPGAIAAVIGCILAIHSKNKLWLPLLAFAGVYFFTLGLSQVRFMRYLLPLLPVLCLVVPFTFQALPKAIQKSGAAALALLMFVGATNVLYPFCVPDPRDQATAFIKSNVTKPVTIALINQPWFYTPPLWPQDYPPPQKLQSGVSPDGRFRFEVVGIEPYRNSAVGPGDWFTANQFEWRESARLKMHDQSEYVRLGLFSIRMTTKGNSTLFKNYPPFELPGRRFVPHDFLYSNPEQGVFQKAR